MSKGFFPKSKIFKLKSDLALEGPHYTSGQHFTTRSLLATTESSHGIKVHEKQVNCAFQNLIEKVLGTVIIITDVRPEEERAIASELRCHKSCYSFNIC